MSVGVNSHRRTFRVIGRGEWRAAVLHPPRNSITIKNRVGLPVEARLAPMTPRYARRLIVNSWWLGLPPPRSSAAIADQSWHWEASAANAEESADFASYLVLTSENKIIQSQGAIACDLRGRSPSEPDQPSLYIQYLAAAPRNRASIMGEDRLYRGVGTELVLIAIIDSFRAGYNGRVFLKSLDESRWLYEKLG